MEGALNADGMGNLLSGLLGTLPKRQLVFADEEQLELALAHLGAACSTPLAQS